MLNNKHTIKEFQQAINDIKYKYFNEDNSDWGVRDLLTDKTLEKFDWFEIPNDSENYVEV